MRSGSAGVVVQICSIGGVTASGEREGEQDRFGDHAASLRRPLGRSSQAADPKTALSLAGLGVADPNLMGEAFNACLREGDVLGL